MATHFWKSKTSPNEHKTNLEICCLCQENTSERLVDLSGVGYITLATNIPQFHDWNAMPIPFDPKRLDDGDGILKTFENNKARYHESCMLKFKPPS